MEQETWQRALDVFTKSLMAQRGAAIAQILLYGSHARGEAGISSDIDILVVAKASGSLQEIEKVCASIANVVSLEYDTVLSVLVVNKEQFLGSFDPLLINVRSEGKQVA